METSNQGAIDGIVFNLAQIFANGKHGVWAKDAGVSNIRITNSEIAGHLGASCAGILVDGPLHDWAITNCRIGPTGGFKANVIGINFTNVGTDRWIISGNNVHGNSVVGIYTANPQNGTTRLESLNIM